MTTASPTRTIVVTGATGTVGRAVIQCLSADPEVIIRADTRRPDAFRSESERVIPVGFDWGAPLALDGIVAGADTMLVVPPPARHPLPTTAVLLDAAAAAGVGHIVFLSTFGADFEPGFTFGRWALAGEHAVAAAGVPCTVLRPNSFKSNFLTTLRPADDGALRIPWGRGVTSFIDPRDVAAVAARVLPTTRPRRGNLRADRTRSPRRRRRGRRTTPRQRQTHPLRQYRLDDCHPCTVDRRAAGADGHRSPRTPRCHGQRGRARVTDDVERVIGRPAHSFVTFGANHAPLKV